MKQVETAVEGYALKVTDTVGGRRLKLLQTDSVGKGVECSEGMTDSFEGDFWASQVVRGVGEHIPCSSNMEILQGPWDGGCCRRWASQCRPAVGPKSPSRAGMGTHGGPGVEPYMRTHRAWRSSGWSLVV